MNETSTPLDQNLGGNPETNIPVSDQQIIFLRELPTWAKIMSVTNFIGAGVQLMSMFWLLPKLRRLFLFDPVSGNNIILLLIILFLIFVAFTVLIGWQLWRYAAHLKSAVQFTDSSELELVYYYQYRYFKTLGWMTITLISVAVLAIMAVIYVSASTPRGY